MFDTRRSRFECKLAVQVMRLALIISSHVAGSLCRDHRSGSHDGPFDRPSRNGAHSRTFGSEARHGDIEPARGDVGGDQERDHPLAELIERGRARRLVPCRHAMRPALARRVPAPTPEWCAWTSRRSARRATATDRTPRARHGARERILPTPGCRAGISEYATNERDIRRFAQNQRRRSRCMGEISAPWANQGMPPQARTIGPRPWEEAK
jgi:hypothetical protein